MYCTDFEYDKEKLSDYGMILCSFDHSGGLETLSSGADLTFHQIQSAKNSRFPLYAATYDTAYTAVFQICKNPCRETPDNPWLSPREVSALQKWLCRKDGYHKFKIDQEDYQTFYWKAVFSAKQIMLNGKIAGLELTMYTDSPYAYLDEISLEFACKANEPFSIYSVSDEEGYLYPFVEITCTESTDTEGPPDSEETHSLEETTDTEEMLGSEKTNLLKETNTPEESDGTFLLELSNSMDNKKTQIKGCKKGEVLTLDGFHLTISSSEESHTSLSKDFNYAFPKIIRTYKNSKNDFTVNRDCTILFRYSPICKIGL